MTALSLGGLGQSVADDRSLLLRTSMGCMSSMVFTMCCSRLRDGWPFEGFGVAAPGLGRVAGVAACASETLTPTPIAKVPHNLSTHVGFGKGSQLTQGRLKIFLHVCTCRQGIVIR